MLALLVLRADKVFACGMEGKKVISDACAHI